ncbi:RagB/SusD family nutrient uptake outer membrane protein [Parapedobacter sp. ISTM3]|uniref:RagB/SusD family nutrient uptake outer membrane protein n=1 Tax=Parapedobacter sp. ISTM3 TaxID=2800130 RepID=UPI00190713AD|nr:RagB/SusD family nutrient uptake outer membrane protein [Parapedobacter sp. ISTM3]MBK1438517.1 RagB/SusD family nutrient uptake outer membrane protein [Parapedobacter sp. ISTM3]
MKTQYKRKRLTYLALGILSTILVTACGEDWLGGEPLGRWTEDDMPAGSLEGQVFGIYAGLRSEGTSGLPYVAIHNIRADDANIGGGVGDEAGAGPIFDDFGYPLDYWLINNYWTNHYSLIALTNNLINDADSLENPTELTAVNVGEARFVRAFAYFNLVRTFGEVPKIDFRIYTQDQAIVPKSSIAEIYALIDEDLNAAVAVLPNRWEERFSGRITRGAALALQAKTHLARGSWGAALAAAEAVISSGEYDLSVPYDMIFREESENSKESVFEIQAHYTQNNTGLGITLASRQGVRGAGEFDLGWGWNVPNEILLSAFEEGDPRKDVTVLYSDSVNAPYGERIPGGLERDYWNKKVYTNPSIRRSTGSRQGQWFNFRVIRYADVVLMAAEAANEMGNTDLALEYLEQVRARARGANVDILPPVTTRDQEELRQAIRHERQVELGMENERFYDLVRWGIDVETFHAAGKTSYQPRHRFIPIPQVEIDRSGGVLEQNPDYR